jgi:hypothetical protein
LTAAGLLAGVWVRWYGLDGAAGPLVVALVCGSGLAALRERGDTKKLS